MSLRAILIAAIVVLSLPAAAQTKLAVRPDDRAGPITSEPGGSLGAIKPDDLWGKIQAAKRDDLVYAQALALASGTEGGRIRAACWGAWIELIDMQQGRDLKDAQGTPLTRPEPSLFSRFEALAQLSDALQPNAKFQAACAPVAQGLRLRILDFVGKVVGGGISLGTLVPGL